MNIKFPWTYKKWNVLNVVIKHVENTNSKDKAYK